MLTYSQQVYANVSDACHADGNFCDGTNENAAAADGICACSCHSASAPNFRTYDDVRGYHLPDSTYRLATDDDPPHVHRIRTYDGYYFVLREQYR